MNNSYNERHKDDTSIFVFHTKPSVLDVLKHIQK